MNAIPNRLATTSMGRRTRAEVERIAGDVLIENGVLGVPVDPLSIARQKGIEVKNAEFNDEKVSGLISKSNGRVQIFVKNSDSPNRKKFTIAHEIGHFFLHLQIEDGDFVEFRSYNQYENPDKEIEANQFAAALLMPEYHVIAAWQLGLSVEEMAMKFEVSPDSMKYRLVNLGLLNVGMI